MSGKEHRTIGIIITIPIVIFLNVTLFEAIIGIAGSTAPDIDLKLRVFGIKHRTITHSLVALILTTVIALGFSRGIAIAWFSNYLLHLVFDSFTPMGVPYFYPFIRKKYKI